MPTSTPLSARVRTVSQERVDKIDFDLLQELVDQGVRRQMGNLLGVAQGAVSPFVTTYDAALFTLTFGKFAYCGTEMIPESQDAGTSNPKGWRGGFYVFSPSDEFQTSTWSIAAARAAAAAGNVGSAYPYILVKPDQVPTKTEARIQWSGGAETPVSVQTQLGIRHIFSFSDAYPSDLATTGYAVVGRITAWSAFGNPNPGTPTVQCISMWDNPRLDTETQVPTPTTVGGSRIGMNPIMNLVADPTATNADIRFNGLTGAADLGLVKLLGMMRNQIARIMDTDTAGWQWWADPSNPSGYTNPIAGGLSQVWDKLSQLWTDYDTLMVVRPWACGFFVWNPAPTTYTTPPQDSAHGAPRNVPATTTSVPGTAGSAVVLTLGAAPTGWRYTHVTVTPIYTIGAFAATSLSAVDTAAPQVYVKLFSAAGAPLASPFYLTAFITKDV